MDKILLLEDDVSLIDGLTYSLRRQGYELDVVRTVAEALALLPNLSQYVLLLLDVTLPDGTGFEVCERVRAQNHRIPIIFLTASDEEVSIIRGLDSGGDDYMTKPAPSEIIQRGDTQIDLLGSRAYLDGRPLDLTGAEYRLLCLLVRNAGRVVTRDTILSELWDDTGNYVDGNTLSVYVRRLREKVEADPSHPLHLLTVRGFGYQWKEVSP